MMEETNFITAAECQDLADAMMKKYRIALKGRTFSVEAKIDGPGVYAKVVLATPDESFYYPIEARVMFQEEEMTESEAALFLIDYIDIYLEEFLLEEDEALYLPIDWKDFEYEAVNFQLKGQVFNKKLDEMADRLLEGLPPLH